MKDILFKYPQYSFSNLLEGLTKEVHEERVSKSLTTGSNSWYRVTKAEYRNFMIDWAGEPLDIVKAHDYYSWMGMSHYYVYTTESRKVLARIKHSDNQIEYFLALNA